MQHRSSRQLCVQASHRVPQLLLSQQMAFLFSDSLTQHGAALMSVASWGRCQLIPKAMVSTVEGEHQEKRLPFVDGNSCRADLA